MITADQKKAESAVDLLNNDFVIFKYFVLYYLVSSNLQTTLENHVSSHSLRSHGSAIKYKTNNKEKK